MSRGITAAEGAGIARAFAFCDTVFIVSEWRRRHLRRAMGQGAGIARMHANNFISAVDIQSLSLSVFCFLRLRLLP